MSENKVLLVAEHDGNTLNPSTARALACAREIGAVHVAVFAADGAAVAGQAAALEGVDQVRVAARAENEAPVAAVLAPQVAALASDYDVLLAPSTTFGKDLLPRVAALLGVPQVSDIMEVVDAAARTFRRPMYAGNAIVDVRVPDGVKIVGTVRTASFQAVAAGGEAAPVETVAMDDVEVPAHTTWVGLAAAQSERPDLQSATCVVSGGRGVGSEENFRVIFSLADKLGAAVGASRAAVDAGYVPNDMQVGQTGKIIAPDLYFAIGISGAIQHLTGIKDAGVIVAINKDPEAPIFEVADYGLVGDLFELLPQLEAALD